ncbi:MAG: hypothetical protein AB7T86_12565 [Xanthobacteraceae bacterium]|uniref:hypothetical protein n=1 Tax=Pseudolabrys sp. TaxID=1960880 RepID=UPI003D0B31A1
MADAITSLIGGVLMTAFILLIVAKLNQLPLWIISLVGLALMAWAIWTDALAPLFRRSAPQR